jgi:hypothetical protein
MKQSWIMGVFMFYLVIFGLETIVTGGTVFSNNLTSSAGTLIQPSVIGSGNIAAQTWAIMSNIGGYIAAFVAAVFLWSPTVFSGYMVWAYWFICFPIACGMIYGVVSLIRGTG